MAGAAFMGFAMGRPMRAGDSKSAPPPSGALALALAASLAFGSSSCSTTNRQVQMNVVEVATQAANELGQGMLGLYQYQLQHCVEDSSTEMAYTVCKMGVDQVWGKARLSYSALRRTQDEYAAALEKNELKANEFLEWFRISYCELKASAPPELVLPPVPGLTCGDV